MTIRLYIDQTGEVEILREKAVYFKDEQIKRGCGLDTHWDRTNGVRQENQTGEIYEGSVLEHMLLQMLYAFYDVGEHNHIRLRGADWNDALDMAPDRGESVAFTCAYAGNLMQLAQMLMQLAERFGWKQVEFMEEMGVLLQDEAEVYDSISVKQELLRQYVQTVSHQVSGRRMSVDVNELAENLRHKAEWMQEHIRKTEWIQGDQEGWFNSY